MDVIHLAIVLVILVFSTAMHSSVHALMAAWLGDPSGVQQGRVSLNPVRHIEVFWTLLMPVILFIISSGSMAFGMARPVPFNSVYFRSSGWGVTLTLVFALVMNLMIALFGFISLVLLYALSPSLVQPESVNAYFLGQLVFINMLLVVVNCFVPIPPLDSSRLVRHFMKPRGKAVMDAVEPFGFLAVMLLLALVFVGKLLDPVYDGIQGGMGLIFDADYAAGFVKNLRGLSGGPEG